MDLSDDDLDRRRRLLDEWVATRTEIARLEAAAMSLLRDRLQVLDADVSEHPFHRDAIRRSMIAEYAAAGRIAQGTVDRAFTDAHFLERHPGVAASFGRGAITAMHVHEIIAAGAVVREAVADGRAEAAVFDLYEAAALVVAESTTCARTRAEVRRIAASLAGEMVVEQHRRAAGERSVTIRSVGDGLALLQVVLPEHLAVAILDRMTRLAHQILATSDERVPMLGPLDDDPDLLYPDAFDLSDPVLDDPMLAPLALEPLLLERQAIFGDGTFALDPSLLGAHDVEHVSADVRTLDQIRADLAADLLLACDPSTACGTGLDNIQGRVQVTIAASTLIGADDRPAELDGFGPIDPDIARDLAGANGGWSRLFLDSTGMVTSTEAYAPTTAMRRFLRARDPHCRFPGCRMPVHRCQFDHNHDHARGGATRLDNLSAFCVGHHVLKHPDIDDRHRWSARQRPDGSIEWTSPLGRAYIDLPPRRVMFV